MLHATHDLPVRQIILESSAAHRHMPLDAVETIQKQRGGALAHREWTVRCVLQSEEPVKVCSYTTVGTCSLLSIGGMPTKKRNWARSPELMHMASARPTSIKD